MTVGLLADRDRGGEATPVRRRTLRGVFRRLRTAFRSVPVDARSARLRRLDEVCAVLAEARTLIEHGWLQDSWYAVRSDAGTAGPADMAVLRPPGAAEITKACLVGAVVHATRRRDPAADLVEAGPALDVLWDAWQESRGLGGPGVAGRAAPREVRAARVRDLTRWNDRPGRTGDEVLGLLDLATSRAIMEAANTRATPATASRTGSRVS
jgi:hypothetical protein